MEKKEIAKVQIQKLVERYQQIRSDRRDADFSEADVGSKFILPLLECLGWDTKNIDEVKEQKQTLVGPVDYSLNLQRRPKVLLELKKLGESLDGKRTFRGKEQTYPQQAIDYAWHMKLDWVILTNFKEIRLYYSHVRRPIDGLVFSILCDKFCQEYERLWILSKESVSGGNLDFYEKRRTRKNIDEQVLEDLLLSRKGLTESIRYNQPDLSIETLRESVQMILDRVLVIRVAEDRNIIGSDSLREQQESWQRRGLPTPLMRSFKTLFRDFDEIYDTKLFEYHQCEDIKIDNGILKQVVERLYHYNFDLVSADILGAIYEDYIGHVLEEKGTGVEIVSMLRERRKAGIYYTAPSLVEYIVRTCLSQKIEKCSTPDEVYGIKVLDPAVGSGSFIIKAFDVFKEWFNNYVIQSSAHVINSGLFRNSIGLELPDVGKRILTDNLFGIDRDPQAAEIASVNIMLKVLEKEKKLPKIIGRNIIVANTLISYGPDEMTKYFENIHITPILWEKDFPTVFNINGPDNGFDVVVGNPPWGEDLSDVRKFVEDKYELAKGQYDSYALFIELSKKLLRDGGIWGFVVPDSIFRPEFKRLREFLCKNFQIDRIIKLGEGFFDDVYLSSVVIIFTKQLPKSDHNVTCMTLLKSDRTKVRKGSNLDLFIVEHEKATLIPQKRFLEDPNYSFDIAAGNIDKAIMAKMESHSIFWEQLFDTWRGVELSEQGLVIQCPNCFKWDSPPRRRKGEYEQKECSHCKYRYALEHAITKENIVVDLNNTDSNYAHFISGEGVNRYYTTKMKLINVKKNGINYKSLDIYTGTKMLIRKTGIGIYATIDSSGAYVPQVVFVYKLNPKSIGDDLSNDRNYKLEYFLGVLNSRLMLYFYYKKFGELEWKSFPYITQKTIQQLPLFAINFADQNQSRLHDYIAKKVATALERNSTIDKELDFEIEDAVMKLYGITPEEKDHIWKELGKVQKLRIIREMMGIES